LDEGAILDDISLQFGASLNQIVNTEEKLVTHNVAITVNPATRNSDPCASSQRSPTFEYNACMIVSVLISAVFDNGMSKCELEYLLISHLATVANELFASFNVSEFWPQVGFSSNQFLLQGVDRLPDAAEELTFEGVVAEYLSDALGKSTSQPIYSVCVDVVNTDYVEDIAQTETALVMARSAPAELEQGPATASEPIHPKKHRRRKRPRGGNEKDVQPTGSTENEKLAASEVQTEDKSYHHSTTYVDDVLEGQRAEEVRVMPRKRMHRQRGDGEGYNNSETVLSAPTAAADTDPAQSEGEMWIDPDRRAHEPRPRQRILQKESTVMFDTVVTGRYRGPKIDMDKKVSDAISGNEYQLAEELEKDDPDYYSFDEDGDGLKLIVSPLTTSPSPTASPPIPVVSIDKDAPQGNWKGLIGFFILGLVFIIFIVCFANYGVRRIRGEVDSSDTSSFSLQSILVVPTSADMENSSMVGSSTSSLSAPQEASAERSAEHSSVLKSILRNNERSILKKEGMYGISTKRRRVRFALGIDENSNSSKSGSTKSSSTNSGASPGAYSVKPDESAGTGIVGRLRDMWMKEAGGPSSTKSTIFTAEDLHDDSDSDSVSGRSDASSDDEESGSHGTGSSPSFAQFSVYGTTLMCTQGEDMTIVTDLYGTAELCREDETITTDNRTPSHMGYCIDDEDEYFDIEEAGAR